MGAMESADVVPIGGPVWDFRHRAADSEVPDDLFASMLSPELPLDPGIARAVRVLVAAGLDTFESCQGGPGHAYPEPTVRFHGERPAGFHALAVAQENGLPVLAIRRTWPVNDGEPTGPWWEIVFRHPPRAD